MWQQYNGALMYLCLKYGTSVNILRSYVRSHWEVWINSVHYKYKQLAAENVVTTVNLTNTNVNYRLHVFLILSTTILLSHISHQ